MLTQTSRVDETLRRIKSEFLEMPGLRLTASQAQRLWGLDGAMCDALLAALVDAKFLALTRDGAFTRLDGSMPHRASRSTRSIAVGSAA